VNIRRGILRLWFVLGALFVLGVGAASYNTIREEFRAANIPPDCNEAVVKQYGGTTSGTL
jgi:hypothetical protein